jgi:hypothetical protein
LYLPVTAQAVILFASLWLPEVECAIYQWVYQTVGHSKEKNSISKIFTKLENTEIKWSIISDSKRFVQVAE